MEGSRGGGSSVQRASSRRWPTAGGARGAVRGRGAKLAGAARCASQCAGCAAGASCIGIGRAQAGPVSAAAACVARRGGQTIFTVSRKKLITVTVTVRQREVNKECMILG